MRTALVWIFSLILYYLTGRNSEIGEPWYVPESFFILFGFLTMMVDTIIYYSQKMDEEQLTFRSVELPMEDSHDFSIVVESQVVNYHSVN